MHFPAELRSRDPRASAAGGEPLRSRGDGRASGPRLSRAGGGARVRPPALLRRSAAGGAPVRPGPRRRRSLERAGDLRQPHAGRCALAALATLPAARAGSPGRCRLPGRHRRRIGARARAGPSRGARREERRGATSSARRSSRAALRRASRRAPPSAAAAAARARRLAGETDARRGDRRLGRRGAGSPSTLRGERRGRLDRRRAAAAIGEVRGAGRLAGPRSSRLDARRRRGLRAALHPARERRRLRAARGVAGSGASRPEPRSSSPATTESVATCPTSVGITSAFEPDADRPRQSLAQIADLTNQRALAALELGELPRQRRRHRRRSARRDGRADSRRAASGTPRRRRAGSVSCGRSRCAAGDRDRDGRSAGEWGRRCRSSRRSATSVSSESRSPRASRARLHGADRFGRLPAPRFAARPRALFLDRRHDAPSLPPSIPGTPAERWRETVDAGLRPPRRTRSGYEAR